MQCDMNLGILQSEGLGHSSAHLGYVLYRRFFFCSVAIILGVVAMGKVLGLLRPTAILDSPDWVFGIERWKLLLVASLVELVIGLIVIVSRNDLLRVASIGWLGAVFIIYRLEHWFLGSPESCECLGRIGDWLPFSDQTLEFLLTGISLYFLFGAILVSALGFRVRRF